MLPAPYRLRRSREFEAVVRRGRRAGSATLVVYALRIDADEQPQVGLVVNRAVGDAVARNRVKRRLRHLLRPQIDLLPPGTRLVLRTLPPASFASTDAMAADLASCLRRLREVSG